jgi:hypothetical protein
MSSAYPWLACLGKPQYAPSCRLKAVSRDSGASNGVREVSERCPHGRLVMQRVSTSLVSGNKRTQLSRKGKKPSKTPLLA